MLLCCLQNETLIAIKAPLGTTLEVPDPDEVFLIQSRNFGVFMPFLDSL